MYNLRDNRDALRDPILALGRDGTKVLSCKGSDPDSVEQHIAHRYKVLQTLVEAQKAALKKLTNCLREAEVQKANLVRLLDGLNLISSFKYVRSHLRIIVVFSFPDP